MWTRALALALVLACTPREALAAEPPALVRARASYNAAEYEAAIDAAAVARRQPEWADAAALVIGRSHIERYRRNAAPDDLAAAREALAAVRLDTLTPRDQLDLNIGLAQALYFGEQFGPAAELFDSALSRTGLLADAERLRLLDWWATALDRAALSRPPDRRATAYGRITDRMEDELRADPANPVASYWLAIAARGAGDLDRAWDAAVAAWIRAGLRPADTAQLRADLDRLVEQALIPERARTRVARANEDAVTALREEWALLKQRWK